MVYIRVLWKEFEPEEGEYNYAFIEDILKKAKENGQTVMFRMMQHSTRESDDVPDWLKEKIECPPRPQGKREKKCPTDPKFLEYFGRAIRALGERFDSDPALAFLDISLPGAWGEGSHLKYFTEEQLKSFVDIYTDSFKTTHLIGQTNAPWLVAYSNQKTSIGWRADCIGPDDSYRRLLPQAEQMDGVWEKGHVSFESYWWLGEWKRKGWDIDVIIERLLNWHVSTFNAKSLPIPYEWQDKIDALVDRMGYHFVIKEADVSVSDDGKIRLAVTVDNVGVAPIYMALPLYVRLKNDTCEMTFKTDIDIRKWLPGDHTEEIEITLSDGMTSGEYKIMIGIGGDEAPSVCFATDAEQDGDFAVLTAMNIGI